MSLLGKLGFSITTLFLLAGASAPATLCDLNLLHETTDPMRYQMRDGRCEGIYAQQVGTVSLDLRSFVKGFGPFDPAKDSKLILAWNAPPGGGREVWLRAFSLKPRTYFRMDTAQPAARGVYGWPSDVLASLRLRGVDLGVLAWTVAPGPGEHERKVYLPLRAATPGAAGNGYEVTLVPSKKLRQLLVTLRRTDDRGAPVEPPLFADRDVGGEFAYYPSNEPTVFSTGTLPSPGYYRLEIKATAAVGDSVTSEIDFYHSGN